MFLDKRKRRKPLEERDNTILSLCPILPDKIPMRKRANPFPIEIYANRPPAEVWETENSSSRIGAMGASIVLEVKVRNQSNQKKRRKNNAFESNLSNLLIFSFST